MKKVISILLSALMIVGCFSFSVFAEGYEMIPASVALSQYEAETGEKVETYRYYFLMPNGENGDLSDNEYNTFTSESNYAKSWYNEYTDTAGIYWWDSGVYDPLQWAGYLMDKADADSVFYADVPQEVTTIIFNNAVDGGMDKEDPLYYLAHQTVNVPCEYYDPGESDNYPNGTESFDNMIFVVDPDMIPVSDFSLKSTYGGEWYYYYGDGCYGTVKDGDHTNCLRADHNHSDKSVKEAIAEYEAETGEKVETNRYYFLMPNGENGEKSDDKTELFLPYDEYAESWYNKYTDKAGIYWWGSGVADPQAWPGYTIEKGDSDSIFYADVPKAVSTIIFNNYIDGGMDPEAPIYDYAKQTFNIPCEYYEPDENINYPNGTESFDNMIFVGDPDMCSHNDLSYAYRTLEGEWYYYYGNGCYGTVKDGDHTNCLRDDHNHDADEILGDVDGDSVVSVIDATAIQRDIAKLRALTDEEKSRADVDGDGEISVLDATAIQFKIAKLD